MPEWTSPPADKEIKGIKLYTTALGDGTTNANVLVQTNKTQHSNYVRQYKLTLTNTLLLVMNDEVNIRMERQRDESEYISKSRSLISSGSSILHPVLLIPTFAFITR